MLNKDNASDCGGVERGLHISVVLPAHNEQEVLPSTHERLSEVGRAFEQQGMGYDFVFVNDGSADATPVMLDEMAMRDEHVRVVHLTRNFGHQAAVSAGLSVARGDVVVLMDADLQDPPEILPQMIEKWREGYQVVYAVRQKRKENVIKRAAYWTFYRLLDMVSELRMPLDSGDFCLLDRSAVDLLNSLPERQRFVRGLRCWIGLKQTGLTYERHARQGGEPSYNFRSLLKLAMDGLLSFSSAPLRLATRLGLITIFLAVLLTILVIIDALFREDTPRGWASLACLLLFLSSIQLLTLGIMGEYLARIFLEVKGRPTFLIAREVSQQNTKHAESGEAKEGQPEATMPASTGDVA